MMNIIEYDLIFNELDEGKTQNPKFVFNKLSNKMNNDSEEKRMSPRASLGMFHLNKTIENESIIEEDLRENYTKSRKFINSDYFMQGPTMTEWRSLRSNSRVRKKKDSKKCCGFFM